MNNFLISIVGPTAIGKTTLSIALAKYFNSEIISSDSRQFFKEMNIGTAVPSIKEIQDVRHHFIQHKSIYEVYNVGAFEKDAINTLELLYKKHSVAVMVGGSGLYTNAVINGLDDFPKVDASIRKELNNKLELEGILPLQKQLNLLDPKSYTSIAIDNPQRLIRALEICIGTGRPYSSFLSNPNKKRNFKTISIGLDADREIIYNRINERVDIMIENGLMEEAKSLLNQKHLNALNTVGYKELFQFFEGHWTKDFAISEIKKNTRRFAKRQLTWFKKDNTTKWFDYKTNVEDIIDYITIEIENIKNPA
ncbi:tRNA (adenosine(37)-N6)-dimethylallyltransferase MiaA [Winogradskyella immobilis]|uniref:tRNA dimethylallyltransferase n=1 Tax=Winogradskyella immobilis TaxID=2816852 RepID=A0ABS8EPJ2_9FLAO|nr:tRNA (adenosine(37)-N6)-dimethylallyltransferase MiaA [Winogradskyella immobilis]MCC1484811.1 tRNA (adenosine(37)-N6)-dimethylallyltransferase MiaA [Winogradskyella immobilis]MCG0016903.1 tRNA (adenosine(37)-N6)-dimethylallyltransferase MiaA [Winogradskyella immobilis]